MIIGLFIYLIIYSFKHGLRIRCDEYRFLPIDFWITATAILSRIVRKPDFCLGENKGADQLRGNREADQRLCFRYTDSTISLLLKSEISSF